MCEGAGGEKEKILVAGDGMLDLYHFGRVDRISPEAPVPVFLESGNEKCVPGGAANVAVNIAGAGVATEFCSMVGEDEQGRKLLHCLNSCGVGTRHVIIRSKIKTSVKLRYIGPGNQQILRVDEEEIGELPSSVAEEVLKGIEKYISEYKLFVLSDYRKGFLTESFTRKLIELAKKQGIPILVDVKSTNPDKYKYATLLKPNRVELRELTGLPAETRNEVISAATLLCKKACCNYILATLGADGMLLVDENGLIQEVRSTASEVYDVTGAGDTSMAYLAVELVMGRDIVEAMEVANYAAGVQVSKVGTSIVYPEEVHAVIRQDGRNDPGKVLDFYGENWLDVIKRKKAVGKRIVFTNGCFDILHLGHISYLRQARGLGDLLVVGVNSDQSVKRLKGRGRPVNMLSDRMMILAALEFVDYVVSFDEDDPGDLIAKILPDVLVKGGDYQIEEIVGSDLVRESGGEVRVLNFVDGRSTTMVLNKLQEEEG